MTESKAFFVTIPHSGEQVPEEAPWLKGLDEKVLMCDVDRFVDRLYEPALDQLGLPRIVTPWHRYLVDLNRLPSDVDCDSVLGNLNPSGSFATGLHWRVTTTGLTLMPAPISQSLHELIVDRYFQPFHKSVKKQYEDFRALGAKKIFHLDAHSMPSLGTKAHRDPGQQRAEIVVSDFEGKSCEANFKDLVIEAYKKAGFQVAYNWPYIGGRLTQTYGLPQLGQHAIQVEMNRKLYMDEVEKTLKLDRLAEVQKQIATALGLIHHELESF